MKRGKKANAKTFRAVLERMRSNLGWVIVRVPFSVEKTWGKRGMTRVKGEINGFPFRKSLFPTRGGQHFLLVNKCNAERRGRGRRHVRTLPDRNGRGRAGGEGARGAEAFSGGRCHAASLVRQA